MTRSTAPLLEMRGVGLVRGEREVLTSVDWRVDAGQRWVVMGRNGCGKTSLLQIASLALHPTRGEVELLGETLGKTDVRALRKRIGIVGAAVASSLRPGILALDAVMTARHGALEPWWHTYTTVDVSRAEGLLGLLEVGHVAEQAFGTLSSGERQRVLLARALMREPELLLLDEPTAGLDLGGREEVVSSLERLAQDSSAPPAVLVTHHVEEIPSSATHAMLIRAGSPMCAGHLDEVVTSEAISACFGVAVDVERDRTGRFSARRQAPMAW